MKKLFGTDGMRGVAGRFPLDAKTIEIAGRSLARHLRERLGRAPFVITGRDTRALGGRLEAAFHEGVCSIEGARCESAGIITTPGVAYLAGSLPADAGVVLSASHNPFEDNGVKIFAPDGRKVDDQLERAIETDIYAATSDARADSRDAHEEFSFNADAGERAAQLQARYLDHLSDDVAEGLRLKGLRVVVDCANGAAYRLAPELFKLIGADVVAINDSPDGRNINANCGSLHLEGLQRKVFETGAAIGAAYDGDADRALFVNSRGEIVDGDATLWVMAKQMLARGEMTTDNRQVVATVMSNIGLERALASIGVELRRTDVGDKYVLEELLRTGAPVGGEQSGHIIFPRRSLVGDGLVTTIQILRAMIETNSSLEALTEGFVRYPQTLVNVRVREKLPFQDAPEIKEAARRVEETLGANGRLLLRYSGTEPLARVMIEGERQDEIERLAADLAGVIKRALGGES